MKAWLVPIAFLVGSGAVFACQGGAEITYAGREQGRAVEAEQIDSLAGRLPPEGYTILGVVTARCTTVDGASGLLAEPCDEETMMSHLRTRAAAAGATALLDLHCDRKETDRHTESGDAGTVTVTVRETLTCQGTALRHEGRRPAPPPAEPSRRITVGGVEVAIEGPTEPSAGARDPSEVGELETFPEGYRRIGRIRATCLRGCARNTARLAIREMSARLGAVAFAELRCDLDGDRWHCEAIAVGD